MSLEGVAHPWVLVALVVAYWLLLCFIFAAGDRAERRRPW